MGARIESLLAMLGTAYVFQSIFEAGDTAASLVLTITSWLIYRAGKRALL